MRLLVVLSLLAACGCGNGLSLTPRRPDGGTRYTILLHAFDDPMHVEESKRWKAETLQDTGWEDVYIVHQEGHSALYRGRYPSIDAAQDDLQQAKDYDPGTGVHPYAQALVIPLPGEHVGPPEWDLSRADGTWTVKVAVFYDVPEKDYVGRKQFAVDYCRRLRDNGYEAYYAHGPAKSHVYIGSFPATAVSVDRKGNREKLAIHSAAMQQTLQDFPQLAVNGSAERIRHYDPQTKQLRYVERRSRPVRIVSRDEQGE
jgi:hypothetical protein